jgi:ubiquitin-protein ligase
MKRLADPFQLISVISLLSQEQPDLNSPANVDAAKEVREDFPSKLITLALLLHQANDRRLQEESQAFS